MTPNLETLLQRIADGVATDAEVDEARALLDSLEADGLDGGAIASALALDSEDLDLADQVMAALELEVDPVGRAVRDAAGAHDGAHAVMAALQLDDGLAVGDAVRAEAGSVEVAGAVMRAIGVEASELGEAVRSEAGSVDVADAVMAAIATPAGMPVPVREVEALPEPANNPTRWFVALLAAALVAVVLGAGSLMGAGPVALPVDGGVGIAATDKGDGLGVDLMFASASEVEIVDLSFGDDVVVFQDEGDDGALILWVDEEVL